MQFALDRCSNRLAVATSVFWKLLVLTLVAVAVVALPAGLQADEEYDKFLQKLKDLGNEKRDPAYYEIAFDYLTFLDSTDLVSGEVKQSLSYEKGTLLIGSAKFIKSKVQRDKVLVTGKSLLEKFIEANEFHPYAPAAKNELANLLIITARQKVLEDAGKGSDLIKSAQKDLVAAGNIVVETKEALKGQLEKIPANPTDPRLRKRRRDLENEYLRARLMLPSMQEELSETYAEGSDFRKKSLEVAAEEFEDVSSDYRTRMQGHMAWVFRGRVLAKLGKPKEALAVFRETFEQPDSSGFRELKRMSLELAFPIWLADENTENGFIEAVKVTEPIIALLTPQEERSAGWLAVRLDLARAYRQLYEYLVGKPEKSQEEKIQQTKALQKSTALARMVASSNREVKREAQQLLVDWGARTKVDPVTEAAPTNFVEARERAGQVLAELEIIKKQVNTLQVQLAGSPANSAEVTRQLNEANLQLVETPRKALEFLQMAIGFSGETTPVSDINLIRYQMCFCFYTLKDYFRAALIGEFLLDRFPGEDGAKQSAAIAMYSYWDLYLAANDANKSFEEQKVNKICSRIMAIWPDASEAAEAVRMLIAIALDSGDLERAVGLLAKIPETSVHRWSIELTTGQAVWINYLKSRKSAEDAQTLQQQSAALIKIRDQAEQLLTRGVSAVTVENVSRSKAKSVLSLAKIYGEKKDGKSILALMEKPESGLLNLVRTNHASVEDPRVRLDILRIALKGYVQSLGPNSNANDITIALEKAGEVMQDLKKVTDGMPAGEKTLVSLYYSFANDIKNKMESLSSIAVKKNFSDGLAKSLKDAANSSSDLKVIMWAAGTLVKVGDSFSTAGQQEEAKELYKSANSVMDLIDSKNVQVTPDEALDVMRNRGKSLLGSGDYEKAINVFVKYLTTKPATLDVQIDAAMAYQKWGEKSKDKGKIVMAVMGGGVVKDPKTNKTKKTVWGWGKLSQAISSRLQFKTQFLTARYNLAKSRLIYAKIQGSSKLVEQAQKDIDGTRKRYPDLGGAAMQSKFKELEKEIQANR